MKERVTVKQLPVTCDVDGCQHVPKVIMRVWEPDVVGYTQDYLCRKHFMAKRDAQRAYAEKHGMEFVEE